MKVSAIALALFFALGSTLAVAQGAGGAGGARRRRRGCVRVRVEAPVLVAQVAEPPVPAVQVPPVEGAQPEQLEQPAQPEALPT